MKRLAFAVLIILAPPALADVACYGGTVVYAQTLEACPKRIYGVTITPTVGGFDLTYDSDGGLTLEIAVEAGHDQFCPGCPYSTNTSDLTERRINYARLDDQAIKNATGMAVNSQQANATAGEYTISVTGLGNESDYSVHLLPIQDDGWYGQAWQRNVTTLTAGGDTTLNGAQRFVKNGGSDLADGLTHATAWATESNCESGMSTGTDCRFNSGDSFGAIRIVTAHSGTASDFAVFGCYKWNGAEEVACNVDGGDTRPYIGGDLNPTCIAAGNCGGAPTDYFSGKSVPSGYTASVDVYTDYVEVSDLEVAYVAGIGIQFSGDGSGAAYEGTQHHTIVRGNLVHHTGKQGIVALNGAQDFVIIENEIHNHTQCYAEAYTQGLSSSERTTYCDGIAWGAALLVARNYDAQGLVELNDIHDVYGEGININQGTTHVIVRGNRVGNTYSTTLYCDMASRIVYESNIIWGVSGGTGDFSGSGGGWGGGMAANVEKSGYGDVEDCIFRNNLAMDGSRAILANVFADAGAYDAGLSTQFYAYGNTHLSVDEYGYRLVRRMADIEIKSNLIVTDDVGAAGIGSRSSVVGLTMDADYNYFTPTPSDSTFTGANDVYSGVSLATTELDWDAADWTTDLPTVDDFRLLAGSAGIGAGDPTLDTEALPGGVVSSDFGTFLWDYTSYPFAVNTASKQANWSKKLYYDFEGTVRDASTPDIGALEYAP